jgi:CO/xanthine dehydrogenase FAD-binding subunit
MAPDSDSKLAPNIIDKYTGVKNTEVANHKAVRDRFPVLAQAILNGASGQIRKMATVGGQCDATHSLLLLLR